MRHLTPLRYSSGLFWLAYFATLVGAQPAQTSPPPSAAAPAAHGQLVFGPQNALDVSATSSETGSVLRVGKLQVPIALHEVRALRAEVVKLKGVAQLGIIRVQGEQNAAVLVARRANGAVDSLWTGLTDMVGDPGERHADAIEVGDRDGDGASDVVVGTYDERTQLCGQERTLLAPRAVDPKTLTLKSVLLNRAQARPVQAELTATAVAPVASPPPLLHALRAVSASSSSGNVAESAAAVSDGDLASAWVEGRGLGGRFEFVTLRWAAPERAIRAIAVVLAKEDASARARPRVLSLLGDRGAHLLATLPDDARPGERYWIAPPEPLAWTCLSVSVDSLMPGAIDAKSHAGLAEIEAFTDLDFVGGLDTLVAELADPGPRGDDATQLLANARGDVVSALIATWPHLSTLGRRRVMRVLFGTRSPDPRANEILRSAMRDPDPEVSRHGIELARGRIEGGPGLLLELAAEATTQGDRAALAFAHSAESATFEKLLPLLLRERGTERPVLRDAIALAYRSATSNAREATARWLASSPPIAAEAALALALSSAPESREAAAGIFRASRDAAREFADQWRLVECAAALDDEPEGDAWLARLASESDTWMLRMASLTALQARRAIATAGAAKRALSDPYPRVRANALKVLASGSPDVELLSRYARDDKWFLVRVAAVESLPNVAGAQAVMLAATGDRTPAVRAAAIRALQRAGLVAAWPRIQKLVDNAEEYPEVLAEGIAFAKALCVVAAAPSLHAVVERGLQPDAWTPDQEVALSALETLISFGGAEAAWARDHSASPLVPKQLHDAAVSAAEKPTVCRRTPVL